MISVVLLGLAEIGTDSSMSLEINNVPWTERLSFVIG